MRSESVNVNGWILMWTLLHGILKAREGDIIIIYEVNTCTSHTWKLHIWNYHHFMWFWECTLVMCFFKLFRLVHDCPQTLHLNGWILTWTLSAWCIIKVREGDIITIYEVNTSTSHIWKLHIWNNHYFMCFWECTQVMFLQIILFNT